jgi:ribosome-associated toxin RatA of RatAB toxin-antitoxin module
MLTFTKEHSDSVPAPPEVIYEILTDYGAYAEWMPLIGRGQLLAVEGNTAIAEFNLTDPKDERVAVECVHDKNRMVLTQPIEGDTPFTRIQWDIEPEGTGKSKVHLTMKCTADARWLSGSYANFPENAIKGLQNQASAFSAEFSADGPDGSRLLEIFETEEGLICWLNGKKYIMKEA